MLLSIEQQKWVIDWLNNHKIDRCPVCNSSNICLGNALFERSDDRPKVQIYCCSCGNVLFFDAATVFNTRDLLTIWNSKANQIGFEQAEQFINPLEKQEPEDFNPS